MSHRLWCDLEPWAGMLAPITRRDRAEASPHRCAAHPLQTYPPAVPIAASRLCKAPVCVAE